MGIQGKSMKILMITTNDPAGMAIAFTNAINRYTEHTARLITTESKYKTAFEADIHMPDIIGDDFSEVEHLLKSADIFHFHVLADENMLLGPLLIRNYIKGKRVLHHEHGHPYFLANADAFIQKYKAKNRKTLVSTPDLLKWLPGSIWLPNIVPIKDVQFMPWDGGEPDAEKVWVCQAPTRKYHKDTKTFMRVMERVEKKHPRARPAHEHAGQTDALGPPEAHQGPCPQGQGKMARPGEGVRRQRAERVGPHYGARAARPGLFTERRREATRS